MIIRIKHTNRELLDDDGDWLFGYCSMPTPESMVVEISKRRNKRRNTYAGTTLHELIHAWMNLLALKGFKVGEDTEENFAQLAESLVIAVFKKLFGRKNYGNGISSRSGIKQRSARVHRQKHGKPAQRS